MSSDIIADEPINLSKDQMAYGPDNEGDIEISAKADDLIWLNKADVKKLLKMFEDDENNKVLSALERTAKKED